MRPDKRGMYIQRMAKSRVVLNITKVGGNGINKIYYLNPFTKNTKKG